MAEEPLYVCQVKYFIVEKTNSRFQDLAFFRFSTQGFSLQVAGILTTSEKEGAGEKEQHQIHIKSKSLGIILGRDAENKASSCILSTAQATESKTLSRGKKMNPPKFQIPATVFLLFSAAGLFIQRENQAAICIRGLSVHHIPGKGMDLRRPQRTSKTVLIQQESPQRMSTCS